MDGTLIDTVPSLYSAYCDVSRLLGKSPSRGDFDLLVGASVRDIALSLASQSDLASEIELQLTAARSAYLPEKAQLFDGAREFLCRAKDRGKKIWLVTSANRQVAEDLLGHTEIRHYFDGLVSSDGIKVNKPNPEIYLKALELAGANSSRVRVFEDSLQGLSAALSAGLAVIACNAAPQIVDRFQSHLQFIGHFDDWHLLNNWFFDQEIAGDH